MFTCTLPFTFTRGLMAQVSWLSNCFALFYIHQMNQVNFGNNTVIDIINRVINLTAWVGSTPEFVK